MKKLIIFSVIGFFAQLIDGSLGMGFGATSSSLLLMFGIAPAAASASIHMAEIATTAASGASHLWFKNVDKGILWKLTIPGAISAFIGAAFLSSLPGDKIKPFISIFLIVLGIYILIRFLFFNHLSSKKQGSTISSKFLTPLGIVGGFFDAVGGGGWGPITAPVLIARNGISPKKVIGTVDTSEFAIAVSATLGFILFLGMDQYQWQWVIAFMIGGVIAAPIAAWLVRIVPSYMLGVLVGGFIIFTNSMTIIKTAALPVSWATLAYALIIVFWMVAIIYQLKNRKRFVTA
ncbi:sulfite exporter TauE/SafE family protein [Neobacillus sp. CF12]|uniref:sulfite exporter TauE/SafE family protein n=1 Tax=Neobacillus sp. CF12 TaxID=3055864 RepID=UPI0025A19689|nr:sulfite exporter TauE/SafE family protein [Neobacillus sp. CF12]MDM5329961.1 sulfite exporter TauE/SafE family protein [Neobacillus sp. CF12]